MTDEVDTLKEKNPRAPKASKAQEGKRQNQGWLKVQTREEPPSIAAC